MSKIEFSRLLTEREARKYLSCSRSTLYRLRKAGMLSYVQLGSSIRYRPRDLAEYMTNNTVNNFQTINLKNED